jgi:hypothetical protein
MLLAAGAILGILAIVITTLPPLYWFTDPRYQNLYPIMAAWSITWLSFNVFAVLLALIPTRGASDGPRKRCGCCRCYGCLSSRWRPSFAFTWCLRSSAQSDFSCPTGGTSSARSNGPHA